MPYLLERRNGYIIIPIYPHLLIIPIHQLQIINIVPHYISETIILPMSKSFNYLESSSQLGFNQVHIIHVQLCLTQNSGINYSYESKLMPLVKDFQGRAHKFNYLFSYLSILLPYAALLLIYNFYL
jgi:hypothetical protein